MVQIYHSPKNMKPTKDNSFFRKIVLDMVRIRHMVPKMSSIWFEFVIWFQIMKCHLSTSNYEYNGILCHNPSSKRYLTLVSKVAQSCRCRKCVVRDMVRIRHMVPVLRVFCIKIPDDFKLVICVSKSNTRDMVHLWCSSVHHNTTKNHMKGAPLYGNSPIGGKPYRSSYIALITIW